MRHLNSLVIFCCIVMLADVAGAASIYRWRGPDGALQFSNRPEIIPEGATEVTLPALREDTSSIADVAPNAAPRAVFPAARARRAVLAPCAADASGVAAAVATRLGPRRLNGLTLIVSGIPIAYDSDTNIALKGPDGDVRSSAATEQAAIAYPAGTRCPARPPLERYPVTSGHTPSRRLCEDYRRAFAEVGVAVSRDQGVARSFREIAEEYVAVAARNYTAGGRAAFVVQSAALTPIAYATEDRVPLPPWVVDAHIAQTRELAAESASLVDELTVALEEIDSAARRAGCW